MIAFVLAPAIIAAVAPATSDTGLIDFFVFSVVITSVVGCMFLSVGIYICSTTLELLLTIIVGCSGVGFTIVGVVSTLGCCIG